MMVHISRKMKWLWVGVLLASIGLTACSTVTPLAEAGEAVVQEQAPENTTSVVNYESNVEEASTAETQIVVASDMDTLLTDLYENVNPSVVNIQVRVPVSMSMDDFSQFPGMPDLDQSESPDVYEYGQGSGFVYDKQGHIVTNYHVVSDADQIRVTFADGLIVDAELVGVDPHADLAVIQVNIPEEDLHPLSVGDSSTLEVGQSVIAIGNPYGLEGSMTTGIVSALGRTITSQAQTEDGGSFSIPDVIQTDAAINPGNSGGPLLNLSGEVIGINTAIESSVQQFSGIGYAVPSALITQVVPALIETGSFQHPWIGISGTDLTPEIREAMDLDAVQRGVLVVSVSDGGPADSAGLQGSSDQTEVDGITVPVGGDVIVSLDGNPITRFEDLLSYITEDTVVGQDITLEVLRGGKTVELSITLEARPS